MAQLKQSTTYTRTFFMVSSSDHIAAKTGAAPTVNIAKAGGAFGAAAGTVTEIANGWYKVALTTADTGTLGDLSYHITGTGADDTDFVDQVFAKTVDDLMSTFTLPTNFSALSITAGGLVDITQAAADKVWSSATRTLTAFSTALAVSVWDVLDANIAVASSVGLRLKGLTFTTANKVDATIQAAGDFAQGAADKVWSTATRALTDKAGFALSAAGISAIWDQLLTAITTASTIGKLIKDNLDAAISSRHASGAAVASVTGAVGSVGAGGITASSFGASAIDAAALATDAVNEIRDAVTGAAVDGATTVAQSLRLANSALGGKSSGHAAGTPIYRDLADSKNRITATTDVDGNRTAVTTDLT